MLLDARQNRINYGEALSPPPGYEMNYAVGTTYSLDLNAVMLIPVALFFSEEMDFDPKSTREDILESLTRVPRQISIYHQRGKISVPEEYNNLMTYWEKSLIPVQMPQYHQSFHPKVWVIRYKEISGNNVQYKVISTSRNLTFSRDWDLAVTTEGNFNKSIKGQNKPLIDFLKYLNKKGERKIPDSFFNELPGVAFNVPGNFSSLNFYPININKSYSNPMYSWANNRLVMSPFLDYTTLKKLQQRSGKLYLFSTYDALSKIEEEVLDAIDDKFMFSRFIEDAENLDSLSEEDTLSLTQNLHAKFFIDKSGRDISWFIGSANATSPAMNRNIEFMVELKTTSRKTCPTFMKDFLTKHKDNEISLFEAYTGSYNEKLVKAEQEGQKIRELIHLITSAEIKGETHRNNDGTYNLKISIPKIRTVHTEFELRIKPLPEASRNAEVVNLSKNTIIDTFKNYNETELSPFLLFEIWENEMIKKRFVADMKIKLSDNRLKKIFSSIINDTGKFIKYLSFLLSEEIQTTTNEHFEKKGSAGDVNQNHIQFSTPLFEYLLLSSSRNPKKLERISAFIDRFKQEDGSNEIIPESFLELWSHFDAFVKTTGKNG